MTNLFFAIYIFFELIMWIILIDIVLSWLILFWVRFRPEFIRAVIDPVYKIVRKIIPTRIWVFDLTPIVVVLFIIYIIYPLLMIVHPPLYDFIKDFHNNL